MPVVDGTAAATTGPVPRADERSGYSGAGRGQPRYEVQIDSVQEFDSVNARPYLRRLEQQSTRPRWPKVLMIVGVLALIAVGIGFVSQLRSGSDANTSAFGGPGDNTITNPTVDQLAQATVQILGLDSAGEPLCSGSGTFVSVDGLVLTNAHVVTSDNICDFDSLGIAVTDDAGRPPQLLYRADVVALDAEVDLAVVRINGSLDTTQLLPATFPALGLGDSDELGIGDDLRILGYPEIGGETITFTNGSVSGFTAQADIGDRALIKTDATIAGGNSGGAAVDSVGRLIGIPTKARASESGPAVDCRPLADTNGDGEVDEADNCVPIGGFLNGLRPINLARDLIEQARLAPVQPIDAAREVVQVDPASVTMSRPRFSIGEEANGPTQEIVTSMGGISELCLFVDWSGIPEGVLWDGIWWYNGSIIDEYSLLAQPWDFGEEGNNFWMCAIDEQSGLDPGLYELGFFLAGELIFAEGIVLTEEPVGVFSTTWENVTDLDVCGLAINPAGSGQVGLDELGGSDVIPAGGSITIDLPGGEVVVEASDCNGAPLADSAGTLFIEQDHIYTIDVPGTTTNDE